MKVRCTNSACRKHTHRAAIKLKLPGSGRAIDGKWFCSHRCYSIYLADRLINEKRYGVRRTRRSEKLGTLLLKNNLIDKDRLNRALEERTRTTKNLGEILVASGQITEKELKAVLSLQAGAAPISLDPEVKMKLKEEVPFKLVNEFHFVVFDLDEECKVALIAVYDMDDISCLEEYFSKVFPAYSIRFYLEDRKKVRDIIFNNYPKERVSDDISQRLSLVEGKELEITVCRMMDFLNRFCIEEAKLAKRENALWLKGETGGLKIDVYVTKKVPPP